MRAAVCQRNMLEHAPGLAAQQGELLEALLEFFEQYVAPRFPCSDYTFDVYVTTAGRVSFDQRTLKNPIPCTHPLFLQAWLRGLCHLWLCRSLPC
jgi:hypothetical protein